MNVDSSGTSRDVRSLANGLLATLPNLVEAVLVHTEQDLPELQAHVLNAGEDPAPVIASFCEIVIMGLVSGTTELPIEIALRTRLAGERLAGGGIGLEALVELIHAIQREAEVILLEAAPTPEISVNAVLRLNASAGAIVLALTGAYMEKTSQDQLEQERVLLALIRIARAVARSLEPGEVAEAGLRETVSATDLDAGAVWLSEPGRPGLTLQTFVGLDAAEQEVLTEIDLTRHPEIAAAIHSGIPVQLNLDDNAPSLSVYQSSLIVPLTGSRGLLGMMALGRRSHRSFSSDEVIFAGAVADHMATALDHALEHRLEAHTDYLTGLANRAEFESTVRRQLAAAHRSRRPLALVLMDLNGLKEINDRFGHHAGDEAIRAIGQTLLQVVRTSDISARLGGDEFGVAMPEAGVAQAEEVVARIRNALEEINRLPGRRFHIELSYGLAQWEPGKDLTRLYKLADSRLYADKRRNHARSASKIRSSEPLPNVSSTRTSSRETLSK